MTLADPDPTDRRHMRQALRLAARALGHTSPNPLVGCVIVKSGQVVGRGWHPGKGQPHAELFALDDAGDAARGATLYVTLEPCCHWGSTPPCTDAIIRNRIRRVVAAVRDPNPLVNGDGVRRLQEAGIKVEVGVLADEANRLNEAHNKWITTGIPFVTLKVACSLDGKIATASGESRWITGEAARREAHRLRLANDAVLVGVNTILRDDPQLTVRLADGRDPQVVILDSTARTPPEAAVLRADPRRVTIATTARAPAERVSALQDTGARVAVFPLADDGLVDLGPLLQSLGEHGVLGVLVEGGGTVIDSFLRRRQADKIVLMVAPLLIGGRDAPTVVEGHGVQRLADAWRLRDLRVRRLGDDLLIEGYLCSPA